MSGSDLIIDRYQRKKRVSHVLSWLVVRDGRPGDSENRALRLDERPSFILVGKPIAQTLESNIWREPSREEALRRMADRSTILDLLREGFALERVEEEDRGSSVLVRGAAAVAAYPAVSRPDELTDDTSSPRDRDMGFSYPHMDWSPCGLRDELELVLARQLPRADAFDHLPRLITSLRGMRQKVEDRIDIQGDFRGMLTTEVDEMTSKLEKYWKSGEDDEDYYEQDDDCRGADYYWEQHEDCDY